MNDVVETWFRLRDRMVRGLSATDGSTVRPPSLRDACYALALAVRSKTDTTPETIESYVNGLELGAMTALREAWQRSRQ